MTDIDFDELDRAVNSMMKPAADNSISSDSTMTDPVASVPTINTPTPASRPIVNNPRTGRFMDVVPPTANTRVNIAPADTVSRQAGDINPVKQDDQSSPEASQSVAAVMDESQDVTLSQENTIIEQQPESEKEDADIERLSEEINNTLGQTEQPIETPFISGTKVEKRPLGAFSEGSQDANNESSSEGQSEPQGYAEHPAPVESTNDSMEVESIVPEETPISQPNIDQKTDDSATVGAMDSDVTISTPVVGRSDVAATPTGISEQIQPDQTPPAQAQASNPSPVVAPAVTEQPAVNSINQQYQEQPSSGDQTNGAIYDTNDYHKAILQPAKKKSGWWMVLWIFLLLVVGAGSGVAVYFFVLPNL